METTDIKKILLKEICLKELYVEGHNKHFRIIAISDIFKKLNPVEKQQYIYYPLMKYITNNDIHAISIKTYTPEEWSQQINKIF
ncbi:MAG: BolA/IbaG family iron-sulfur metabolism protein [Candidatus Dasytiphilus stammeri]